MKREQAEAIYDKGKDAVVEMLLALESRIAELERQLGANSRNSNKPPSKDDIFDKPPRQKSLRKKTGRRSGGQQGHAGKTLEMVEAPDHVIEHWPVKCEGCGGQLAAGQAQGFDARQVHDLPPLMIEVFEHRGMRVCCEGCGQVTRGEFPGYVKSSVQYGPGVAGLALYMQVFQLLPLERSQEMLGDTFHSGMGEGTLVNIKTRAVQLLAPITEQIRQAIGASKVVNFDETGMRVTMKLWWLHSASTPTLTYYAADPNRGTEAMNRIGILPEFKGIAVHDAYASYGTYKGQHALCNAHLLREIIGLEEMHPNQSWLKRLKNVLLMMKDAVDEAKARDATEVEPKLRARLESTYNGMVNQGLVWHQRAEPQPGQRGRLKASKACNLVERLRDHKDSVLRFFRDFSVPFDNNLAERDLRMMKVKEKISGTFRSTKGAEGFATVRGYVSTVRKQGHSPLAALRALFEGNPLPIRLA